MVIEEGPDIKADEGVGANGVGSEDADGSKGAESLLKRAGFPTARKETEHRVRMVSGVKDHEQSE